LSCIIFLAFYMMLVYIRMHYHYVISLFNDFIIMLIYFFSKESKVIISLLCLHCLSYRLTLIGFNNICSYTTSNYY